MIIKNHWAGLVFLIMALLAQTAHAVSIRADLTPVARNIYRYTYTVTNDGSLNGAPIRLFDISFDSALYRESSLRIVSSPIIKTQWEEIILASVLVEPAAYSTFSSSAGIPAGQSLTGFSVEFEWIAGGTPPHAQRFQIFDPDSFALLEQGETLVPMAGVSPANPVSIPTLSEWGMILLSSVFALLFFLELKKRAASA